MECRHASKTFQKQVSPSSRMRQRRMEAMLLGGDADHSALPRRLASIRQKILERTVTAEWLSPRTPGSRGEFGCCAIMASGRVTHLKYRERTAVWMSYMRQFSMCSYANSMSGIAGAAVLPVCMRKHFANCPFGCSWRRERAIITCL